MKTKHVYEVCYRPSATSWNTVRVEADRMAFDGCRALLFYRGASAKETLVATFTDAAFAKITERSVSEEPESGAEVHSDNLESSQATDSKG